MLSHNGAVTAAFSFPPPETIISTGLTQLISASATYLTFITYYDRPCGEIFVPDDVLVAGPSQIPDAGLGLYTTCALPMGTILGTYPGVIRPAKNFMIKYRNYPPC
eukprot:11921430-Ditylum_brightwellii.AAC.1